METEKRRIVCNQGRRIIAKVYHFLRAEYEFTRLYMEPNCDITHLRDITSRTAEATGVSVRTVQKILKEERELPSTSLKCFSPLERRKKREKKETMGKEEKEDSGFGFKDRAKAEETLKLLEQHEPNYRRLTVRGLLGRAKRVLTMTKAEDKIKNIKEAMEVFEKWLAELDANKNTDKPAKKEKKIQPDSDKSSSSDVEMEDKDPKDSKDSKKALPSDTVPGLGFKDAAAAESTLKELEGRDPEYQRLAVKGLIGRAKRVLTCTRDETKLSNIKAAMSIFDKFLDDFESMHMYKQNNPYVSLGVVRTAHKMAADRVTEQQKSFISAYASVRGEYKRLRTVAEQDGGQTWDIVRNNALKDIKEKHANAKLFNEKDEPTAEHLEMLLWAYSPEPARVKKYIPETKEDTNKDGNTDRKRKHDADNEKEKDRDSERKRKRDSSDDEKSDDDEESPKKRSKE